MFGQMLNHTDADAVAQHVGGGPQTIPVSTRAFWAELNRFTGEIQLNLKNLKLHRRAWIRQIECNCTKRAHRTRIRHRKLVPDSILKSIYTYMCKLLKLITKSQNVLHTHRIQSTIMSREMPSVGSPVDDNTITMETKPACGMPAEPVLAAVTIKLGKENNNSSPAVSNYVKSCITLLEGTRLTCVL